MVRHDERAITSTFATTILVAAGFMLAGALTVVVLSLGSEDPQHQITAMEIDERDGKVYLRPLAGEPLPVAQTKLHLLVDGAPLVLAAASLDELQGDTFWQGREVCIAGPGCPAGTGQLMALQVVSRGILVLDQPFYVKGFALAGDGTIRILCDATVEVKVLGARLHHGQGQAVFETRVELSGDGGATYTPLFGGDPVVGGEVYVAEVTVQDVLNIRGSSSKQGFYREAAIGDDGVEVLRHGEAVPQVTAYGSHALLPVFLRPVVDVAAQLTVLADDQLLLLYEFLPTAGSSGVDYQDLVIVLTFHGGGCSG